MEHFGAPSPRAGNEATSQQGRALDTLHHFAVLGLNCNDKDDKVQNEVL